MNDNNVVDFPALGANAETQSLDRYLFLEIRKFVEDPPDTNYQRGYLAALLNVWDERIGEPNNTAIVKARTLL